MKRKVAINGFGRIGRLALRHILKNRNLEIVCINDLTDNQTLAHLFKYDTAHGVFEGKVDSTDTHIQINRKKILALSERNPANLPWKKLKVDLVLECTGVFRTSKTAGLHLKAGARRVLLSAPAQGEGVPTAVLGVNADQIPKRTKILSNASCTTNCLGPIIKAIDEKWSIVEGTMSTVHAYTAGQRLQDAPHKDLRRGRAAALNIVPTSTGAAKAVELVYPKIKGKLHAHAFRVPVIDGSLIDLSVQLKKNPTREQVNRYFKTICSKQLKNIVEYNTAPIVSSDIVGNPHSAIFDAPLTQVIGSTLRIVAWYDNEMGYSARLVEMANNWLKK